MNELRKQYDQLQSDTHTAFDNLLTGTPFQFLKPDMDLNEDLDQLPNVDYINSMGDQVYVRIKMIDAEGVIHYTKDEDQTAHGTMTFSDINDLYNKISLIEAMEEFIS